MLKGTAFGVRFTATIIRWRFPCMMYFRYIISGILAPVADTVPVK